ncbi:MAG: hypothetical protein OHK0019_37690 [Saprospiraceae bacterium]
MDDQQKIDLLKEEYFHLQKTVEEFDSKAITIKAWSVTGSLAAIAAGFEFNNVFLWLLGAIASILFWLTEGYWKTFQMANYQRINEIESWFRNSKSTAIDVFQISKSWSVGWRTRKKQLWRIMFWPHVALPHIIIVVLGIILPFFKNYLTSIGWLINQAK